MEQEQEMQGVELERQQNTHSSWRALVMSV